MEIQENNQTYYRLESDSKGELVEKKSRFLAFARPVSGEREAQAFLEECRKSHWNARHHCFAYVLQGNPPLQRYGDDGEPQGTAGRPILESILAEGLRDAAVVVVRYFGGVLLGTGGLSRAYKGAAKAALEQAVKLRMERGLKGAFCLEYKEVAKADYALEKMGIYVAAREYGERVRFICHLREEERRRLEQALVEWTAGKEALETLWEGDMDFGRAAHGEN